MSQLCHNIALAAMVRMTDVVEDGLPETAYAWLCQRHAGYKLPFSLLSFPRWTSGLLTTIFNLPKWDETRKGTQCRLQVKHTSSNETAAIGLRGLYLPRLGDLCVSERRCTRIHSSLVPPLVPGGGVWRHRILPGEPARNRRLPQAVGSGISAYRREDEDVLSDRQSGPRSPA